MCWKCWWRWGRNFFFLLVLFNQLSTKTRLQYRILPKINLTLLSPRPKLLLYMYLINRADFLSFDYYLVFIDVFKKYHWSRQTWNVFGSYLVRRGGDQLKFVYRHTKQRLLIIGENRVLVKQLTKGVWHDFSWSLAIKSDR